jgi:hypothetical protein
MKEDNNIEDYDGFSGSPVFKVSDEGNLTLTGMVIRGTKQSKKIIYITIERIYLYLMPLDISVMMLGYEVSDNGLENTVKRLKDLGINILYYDKNKIQIQLDNKDEVTLNPAHLFAFQALHLLKEGNIEINSENLQIMQDFIVKFSPIFESKSVEASDNLISFLSREGITVSKIKKMKDLLHDAATEHIDIDEIKKRLIS